MKIEIEISEQRLADMLCSGMEGGINYWAKIISYVAPTDLKFKIYPPEVFRHVDYPMSGGCVTLQTEEGESYMLTKPKLLAGLETMSKVAPKHFANWLAERDDAETGDVFIQCCLFGKVIYG